MSVCQNTRATEISTLYNSDPSSLVVPGVPGHTHILADQLTLYQPGGTDYANLITTGTPRFSDLPTALELNKKEPDFFVATIKLYCRDPAIIQALEVKCK